jgi:O-antigen/teichoic acid export membrane protein
MSAEGRVARNTGWLVIQPLVLNAASVFAMGYITRTLGTDAYGRFTLAFVLVAMFSPFSNMGLRSITVRDIAQDKDATTAHLAKMLTTRTALSLAAVGVMCLATWLLGYDSLTATLVLIAAGTLVLQAIASTFHDVFQAHERMSLVAYSQFVGGTALTLLSCLVLFAGFGVIALTVTYVIGGAITLVVAIALMRGVAPIRLQFDFKYASQKLMQAAPFFIPNIIAVVGGKIGAVLLSKFATETSVGFFGAASSLTDRLAVIPDGVCTAIYPTLTVLYATSKLDAANLFKRFYGYLLILALPIGVGTSLLAGPIISLICGSAFEGAGPVLIVSVWGLAASFVTSIQFWALGAMHLERVGARIAILSTVVCVVCNVIFIPLWAEVGTALASLVSTVVSFVLVRKTVTDALATELMGFGRLSRVLASCVLMAAAVYPLRAMPVILPIGVGAAVYGLALILFGVISRDEVNTALNRVLRKRAS